MTTFNAAAEILALARGAPERFNDKPALIQDERIVTYAELSRDVDRAANTLRGLSLQRGDRIGLLMNDSPLAGVAFLGAVSAGFVPIPLNTRLAPADYAFIASDAAPQLMIVDAPYAESIAGSSGPQVMPASTFASLVAASSDERNVAPTRPEDQAFWLYSSGTTGLPKGIVHGHGGVTIEMLKSIGLGNDMRPGRRFFWMSNTGWIVWNLLVCGMVSGATAILYDGNPAHPDPGALWRFLADAKANHFGCGAAFIYGSMKSGVVPSQLADLAALGAIHVTGSPLTVEGFVWMYENVKRDLWVGSVSGGTDIASGFIVASPILPVYAGELQCPALGVAAFAYNEAGQAVVNEVGELVITEPMPSMPLYFWNDADGKRYREAYFEMFPGKWRHGDWIRFTERRTSVIYGRSDTTINRHGIRMGTAEIYRAVEDLPEVLDSLVVDLEYLGRPSFMPLFVVLRPGITFDAALAARIKEAVRTRASSRHVPNEVYAVPEIPRTLTGKKMELPVRKLLLGAAPDKVASPESMANPQSFGWFVDFAKRVPAG